MPPLLPMLDVTAEEAEEADGVEKHKGKASPVSLCVDLEIPAPSSHIGQCHQSPPMTALLVLKAASDKRKRYTCICYNLYILICVCPSRDCSACAEGGI